MDSSGAATALQTPLPQNPYTTDAMTVQVAPDGPHTHSLADFTLSTPVHVSTLSRFQSSHIRQSVDKQEPEHGVHDSPTTTDAVVAAAILANANTAETGPALEGADSVHDFEEVLIDDSQVDGLPFNGSFADDIDGEEQFPETESHTNMQAYAKITLPDGDYYVTTLAVKVVRDNAFFARWLRRKSRREMAMESVERYRAEPSQPSQRDDGEEGDPSSKSKSSHSALEALPTRGLPSNYSEQGGAVAYASHSEEDDEDDRRRRRRRRRRHLNSKSSDSTSVAPANLHPSLLELRPEDDPADPDIPVIPIHPNPDNAKLIKQISREHLLVMYNSAQHYWELHVLGRCAYLNGELHKKGAVMPLAHGDNIMVTAVSMTFKLPENRRGSPGVSMATFDESEIESDEIESDDDLDTSPAALRLSNIFDDEEDDEDGEEDEDDEVEQKALPRSKLKLKITKKEKPSKTTVKKKLKDKSLTKKQSPEAAKKASKAKPPANDKTDTQEKNPTPPAMPTNLQPGSILEGLAPDELPLKRKGPGRPPKNGFVSKRDENAVKRKIKEYEKRGEQPPPPDQLIQTVRAENKAKDLAAKAAAKGEAPPPGTTTPTATAVQMEVVVASIEGENGVTVSKREADGLDGQQAIGQPSQAGAEYTQRMSPRPANQSAAARVARSVSPIAPESEFTEEQLKKPNMTYVHILDEVLRHHPIGKADLQELYDRIMKRYPYYKYRVTTQGWQSSVRHNLLQNTHFMENGKSGKGKLWAINPNVPLEKEKKARVPRMSPKPGQHDSPHGSMNGLPSYNPQQQYYGQLGANGYSAGAPGSQYYSPYAHSGPQGSFGTLTGRLPHMPPQYQHPHQLPSNQPNPQYPPQQPNSQTPQANQRAQQQAQQLDPRYNEVVREIMAFRQRFLGGFVPNGPEYTHHNDLFHRCTTLLSNQFHMNLGSSREGIDTDEERRVYDELESIFLRYEHLKNAQSAAEAQQRGEQGASGSSALEQGEQAMPANESNVPTRNEQAKGPNMTGALAGSAGTPPAISGPAAEDLAVSSGTKRAAEDAADGDEGDNTKRARHDG